MRLTKRKEEQPKREEQQPVIERDGGVEDHRRVEDLLQFINSADNKPATSTKAAKRARHKQKKVTCLNVETFESLSLNAFLSNHVSDGEL